jgi:hypothetical protein
VPQAVQHGRAAIFERAKVAAVTRIDQEVVTGIPGAKELTVVAIYMVKDGKIVNVWFFRERL